MVRKTTVSRNPSFLLRVYKTYVKPAMMYATPVWSPSLRYKIDLLESVQRRFTKMLLNECDRTYGQRSFDLDLLSLESARVKADLVTVYKLIHNMLGLTLSEAGLQLCASNTRAKGLRLQSLRASSAAAASLFKFRVPRLWNDLPVDIVKSPTLASFKHSLDKWLHSADLCYFN